MSKLTKPSVEPVDLDRKTLDQVSGGGFLRGGLYNAMGTSGLDVAKSFGTNTEAATVSAPICDDTLITQTYFCPAKVTT
jgi:hypothetical protein